MTTREKTAAALLLGGLVFCTSAEVLGSILGVALLGLGALVLNAKKPASKKYISGKSRYANKKIR